MRQVLGSTFVLIIALMTGCGESIDHKLETAELALASGQPEQALVLADEVLAEEPENHQALTFKAKAHLRLRQYAESRTVLDQLLAENANDEEARREMMTWALLVMNDSMSRSEFTSDDALAELFQEAKTIGHKQADWFAEELLDFGAAEYARAQLIVTDAERKKKELEVMREARRHVINSSNIAEDVAGDFKRIEAEIDSMHLNAARHLKRALVDQPNHHAAARMLTGLLRQREDWDDLWVLASKTTELEATPEHLISQLVGAVLAMPSEVQSEAKRLALADALLETVSDSGRQATVWKTTKIRVLLQRQQSDEAIALAETVIERAPQDVDARFLLGWAYYQQKKYDRARTVLEPLAVEKRNTVQIQLIYGLTLKELGDAVMAKSVLRHVTELDKYNTAARAAFIEILQKDNTTAAAVDDINQLYEQEPSNAQAIRFKMLAEMVQGNKQNVRDVLSAAGKIANLTPEHLHNLALGYLYLGQHDVASQYALRFRAEAPEDPRSHLTYARTLIAQGSSDQAIEVLEESRAKFNDPQSIDQMLGDLYLRQGNLDRVIELTQRSLEASPNNDDAKLLLAQAYTGLSMTDRALELIQEVLDVDEHHPGALELAARIYSTMGQRELAIAQISKIDESRIDAKQQPGLLARLKLWQGELDEALRICQDATNVGKTDSLVMLTMAEIYRRRMNVGETEISLEKYARTNPNQATPFLLLARHYKQHNLERGLTKLRELRSANEAFARLAEAQLLNDAGRNSEAIAVLLEGLRDQLRQKKAVSYALARAISGIILQQDNSNIDEAKQPFLLLVRADVQRFNAALAVVDLEWARSDVETRIAMLDDLARALLSSATSEQSRLLRRYEAAGRRERALAWVDRWLTDQPKQVHLLTWKAQLLAGLRRYNESVAAYRAALEVAPEDRNLHRRIAQVHQAANDYPAAEAAFERMAKIDRGARLEALFALGSMYERLGLVRRSVQTFEELARVGQATDPRVALALGQGLASLGKVEEARTALLPIQAHAKQYPVAQLMLARIEQANPQTVDDAKQRLQRLLADRRTMAIAARELLGLSVRSKDQQQLLEWADAALQMERLPEDLRARWLSVRVIVHARALRWAEAITDIDQIRQLQPERTDWLAAKLAILLHLDNHAEAASLTAAHEALGQTRAGALALIAAGNASSELQRDWPMVDFLAALARADAAKATAAIDRIETLPQVVYRADLRQMIDAVASNQISNEDVRRLALASAAMQLGLAELAHTACNKVLEKHPGLAYAHANRLSAMSQQGIEREAVMKQIVADAGSSSLALYVRVSQLQGEGKYADAIDLARQLVDRNPNHHLAALHLVQLYQKAGRHDESIDLLTQWYDKPSPVKAIVGNDLASLLATHRPQRLDDAHRIIQQAVDAMPESAIPLETRGWINHLQGRNEQALTDLTRAITVLSDSDEVHYHLGETYRALNQGRWARYHLERAAAGDGPSALLARDRLSAMTN